MAKLISSLTEFDTNVLNAVGWFGSGKFGPVLKGKFGIDDVAIKLLPGTDKEEISAVKREFFIGNQLAGIKGEIRKKFATAKGLFRSTVGIPSSWNDLIENEEFRDRFVGDVGVYILVQSIAPGLDGDKWLLEQKEKLSPQVIKSIIFQFVLALAAAQEHCGFQHNDLKLPNIKLETQNAAVDEIYTIGKDVFTVRIPPGGAKLTILDYGGSSLRLEENAWRRLEVVLQTSNTATIGYEPFELTLCSEQITLGGHETILSPLSFRRNNADNAAIFVIMMSLIAHRRSKNKHGLNGTSTWLYTYQDDEGNPIEPAKYNADNDDIEPLDFIKGYDSAFDDIAEGYDAMKLAFLNRVNRDVWRNPDNNDDAEHRSYILMWLSVYTGMGMYPSAAPKWDIIPDLIGKNGEIMVGLTSDKKFVAEFISNTFSNITQKPFIDAFNALRNEENEFTSKMFENIPDIIEDCFGTASKEVSLHFFRHLCSYNWHNRESFGNDKFESYALCNALYHPFLSGDYLGDQPAAVTGPELGQPIMHNAAASQKIADEAEAFKLDASAATSATTLPKPKGYTLDELVRQYVDNPAFDLPAAIKKQGRKMTVAIMKVWLTTVGAPTTKTTSKDVIAAVVKYADGKRSSSSSGAGTASGGSSAPGVSPTAAATSPAVGGGATGVDLIQEYVKRSWVNKDFDLTDALTNAKRGTITVPDLKTWLTRNGITSNANKDDLIVLVVKKAKAMKPKGAAEPKADPPSPSPPAGGAGGGTAVNSEEESDPDTDEEEPDEPGPPPPTTTTPSTSTIIIIPNAEATVDACINEWLKKRKGTRPSSLETLLKRSKSEGGAPKELLITWLAAYKQPTDGVVKELITRVSAYAEKLYPQVKPQVPTPALPAAQDDSGDSDASSVPDTKAAAEAQAAVVAKAAAEKAAADAKAAAEKAAAEKAAKDKAAQGATPIPDLRLELYPNSDYLVGLTENSDFATLFGKRGIKSADSSINAVPGTVASMTVKFAGAVQKLNWGLGAAVQEKGLELKGKMAGLPENCGVTGTKQNAKIEDMAKWNNFVIDPIRNILNREEKTLDGAKISEDQWGNFSILAREVGLFDGKNKVRQWGKRNDTAPDLYIPLAKDDKNDAKAQMSAANQWAAALYYLMLLLASQNSNLDKTSYEDKVRAYIDKQKKAYTDINAEICSDLTYTTALELAKTIPLVQQAITNMEIDTMHPQDVYDSLIHEAEKQRYSWRAILLSTLVNRLDNGNGTFSADDEERIDFVTPFATEWRTKPGQIHDI